MRKLLTAITLAIAIAGAGMGAAALARKLPPSSSRAEVSALRAQLATYAGELVTSEAKLTKVDACLPELESFVNSLSVERGPEAQLWLHPSQQISNYCHPLLEPPAERP